MVSVLKNLTWRGAQPTLSALVKTLGDPKFCVGAQVVHTTFQPPIKGWQTSAEAEQLGQFLTTHRNWRERINAELYSEGNARPVVWLYPAAGYDLGTMVFMNRPEDLAVRSRTFIMVSSNAPFVTLDDGGSLPSDIEYTAENIMRLPDFDWSRSVLKTASVSYFSDIVGGILPLMLGRMQGYFGDAFEVHQAVAFQDASYIPKYMQSATWNNPVPHQQIHGVVSFSLGAATPVHHAIYLHGTLRNNGCSIDQMLRFGELEGRNIPLTSGVLASVDALMVRGSQGLLSPKGTAVYQSTENHLRNHLLGALAARGGLLLEGVHKDPHVKSLGYDPEMEVTLEGGFVRSNTTLRNSTVKIDDGTKLQMQFIDAAFKWSYYPGARASRWSLPNSD